MKEILSGRCWLVGDSVNTDAMYPGFAMKLPLPEAAKHVFYELRPGWTDEVQAGDIVIAGTNFGVGSSRSVAELFQELGVQALLAEEFNSLFQRNCINFGLPALTIPGVHGAFQDGDVARINLRDGWADNLRSGARLVGPGLPPTLLDIVASGGLMPRLRAQGFYR